MDEENSVPSITKKIVEACHGHQAGDIIFALEAAKQYLYYKIFPCMDDYKEFEKK